MYLTTVSAILLNTIFSEVLVPKYTSKSVLFFFQESQEKRGGGTVCINHPKLWLQYNRIINGTDPCMADQ
jgi:hypothetical protein